MLAFFLPVVLAIERVRVERMVIEYWYVKRRKEEKKGERERNQRGSCCFEQWDECSDSLN